MSSSIRQLTIVQAGGVVWIQSLALPEGARAEVIVIIEPETASPTPLAAFIGVGSGGFGTPAEVDAFIRQERDAWSS
ncbi:MAG: hypothetical protein KME03_11070 [Aphanocapsa lilacina HA4352-LM1]|nr:hypothetical protein [Aphanocapsa lilacina HA4352-LM1]